ncbi:hypothetical protein [Kibdelosporangium philippinense]
MANSATTHTAPFCWTTPDAARSAADHRFMRTVTRLPWDEAESMNP